ncbi:ORF325 [White spot syndrome virus]|uniref:Wsv288 n=3 Tax=White spot syndrome virus TaxID=342409 RepID=Q8VAU5_WSSVS|nr:wsv288 [Shrimp white spot syndrome virus]AFX59664.1 wsv288 [White spot syndrome virus]AAL33290.1 wsv288 [Shrimp white spot syndrome virus]AAL89211.1 WSSV343 [Shrimp white spot syndrome virus]ATU83552.1 ORF325 [White spot syndrome virus]AWQ60419.1 wsv288 [Shrimp white spot syndrome virus]
MSMFITRSVNVDVSHPILLLNLKEWTTRLDLSILILNIMDHHTWNTGALTQSGRMHHLGQVEAERVVSCLLEHSSLITKWGITIVVQLQLLPLLFLLEFLHHFLHLAVMEMMMTTIVVVMTCGGRR